MDISVDNMVGVWKQGAREFDFDILSNSVTQSLFVGCTGDPAVTVKVTVKNDKFIKANIAGVHTQVDDLANMTVDTPTYPGWTDETNWSCFQFKIGGTNQVIGRNAGTSVLTVDGLSDFMVETTGMLSTTVVDNGIAPILIAALKENTGTLTNISQDTYTAEVPYTIIIDLKNDTFNELIEEADYFDWITLGGELADCDVETVALTESDSKITIEISGTTNATAACSVTIDSNAFVSTIKTSGVDQQIDGNVA